MASKSKAGWVYFLLNEESSPPRIKIGWTNRKPSDRRRELEYGGGCELQLLGFIWGNPADGNTEWDLHKRFARWKIRRKRGPGRSGDYLGEWFTAEIKEMVHELIAKGRRSP